MEFANFDDDLFEEKPARGSLAEDYCARTCEAAWFLEARLEQLVSPEDEFGVQKFAADYLFLNKSYVNAIAKYEDLLCSLPNGSTTSRRECLESLARCHIKVGTSDTAVDYAEILHSTSRTSDQATVSYSVLLEVYLAAGRHSKALRAAQQLLMLHPDNSHLWMKLGFVYACCKCVTIPNVEKVMSAHLTASAEAGLHLRPAPALSASRPLHPMESKTECSQDDSHGSMVFQIHGGSQGDSTRRDVLVVAACLLRANHILTKTEGTAVGFALTHVKKHQERLLADLRLLLDSDSLKELKKNVQQNDKAELSISSVDSPDSVNKGISEYRNEDRGGESSFSQESFEQKWFKWILKNEHV